MIKISLVNQTNEHDAFFQNLKKNNTVNLFKIVYLQTYYKNIHLTFIKHKFYLTVIDIILISS